MQNTNFTNFSSVFLGFLFALCNKIFGWMNIFLDIHSNFLLDCLQAIITGGLGALSAWLMNKFIKWIEKYIKKKKNGRYRTTY